MSKADERTAEEFAALIMRHKRFLYGMGKRDLIYYVDGDQRFSIDRLMQTTELGRKYYDRVSPTEARFFGVTIKDIR